MSRCARNSYENFFAKHVFLASPNLADLIIRRDWTATPLGSLDTWSPILHTTLELVLANRFPMVFWWGDQFLQFYNDAYRSMIGAKHPSSLGKPAQECWPEIWDTVGEQITSVYHGGGSTWNEDLFLEMNRHGFLEETYFTFSYSPLPDPSLPNGIAGVLATVQETSKKVIRARNMTILRELAPIRSEVLSVEEECRLAVATLQLFSKSVPFSLLYLVDQDGASARLVASAGVEAGTQSCPAEILLENSDASPWALAYSRSFDDFYVVSNLDQLLDTVPPGPWLEPPREAVIIPIRLNRTSESNAFLVAGCSSRLALDAEYRGFFALVGRQIAAAITRSQAHRIEQERVAQIAKLDQAKMVFFSNISHEFRTPLTLMLGPLAELAEKVDSEDLPLVDTANRNALRLLKLVNVLLDFSQLEEGRLAATFVETDLGKLTHELCGVFRSAIESAGLQFSVEIDVPIPVAIDQAMWEKIILNLLSNALKFTFTGEIRVVLCAKALGIELQVRDTGVGIPQSELPYIFERFHRVVGRQARSHEGSGIGLALVCELVHLHGGKVQVESEVNRGSSFTISIPHLRRGIAVPSSASQDLPSHGSVAKQYLADHSRTVESNFVAPPDKIIKDEKRRRILCADDNSDFRSYLVRLLSPKYDVVTVADGLQALELIRAECFDLVVSDVMMPKLDGFELLGALRSDPELATMPVIMLSARAGGEATIDGLSYGANDYLVKPFTAEQLLARVQAQLFFVEMSERESEKLRSSEERFRTLASSLPHIVIECDANGVINYLSSEYERYTGRSAQSGFRFGWRKVVHPEDIASMIEACRFSYRNRKSLRKELRLRRVDGMYRWHVAHILPQMSANGKIVRWTGSVSDIDDQHRAAQERKILSDASQSLAQSLDVKTMMDSIAELAVKELCDWCEIDLLTPKGDIETYVLLHRDPQKQPLLEPLIGSVYVDHHGDMGPPYVIRTGKTWLTNATTPQFFHVTTGTRRAVYRQLGAQAVASVPMISHGQVLGAITLVCTDIQRTFSDDMLAMFEELGRRVGSATHNVRKFEQEHRIAESFQKASLSPELPIVPGVSFDAAYIPAASDLQVGGDWYDAVRLFDGRVVISIGDVTGHGLRAAVTMGNIRQIIRGIAQVHANPALILDAADRALRLESPDQIATAFVGVLDPITGEFSYASAGHPAPILRHADGSITCLSDGGLPLGLRTQHSMCLGGSLLIPSRSKLVLYTDGLTEFRRMPLADEELLQSIIEQGTIFDDEYPAQALYDTFLAGQPSSDDVAILVVDINLNGVYHDQGENEVERWTFDALDATAAQKARREFTQGLHRHGATLASINAAELVFGELVGNTARYAPGAVEVVVDWSVSEPVLHVLDVGKGYNYNPSLPRDIYSEAGRGLYIVSAFTKEFHVEKRLSGGSHARAVLSKIL